MVMIGGVFIHSPIITSSLERIIYYPMRIRHVVVDFRESY